MILPLLAALVLTLPYRVKAECPVVKPMPAEVSMIDPNEIRRTVAAMDDVELQTAWQAALAGRLDVVSDRLKRAAARVPTAPTPVIPFNARGQRR